ncbi:hypothetical protein [Paenibacillus sp. NAIST15-1]|uniref:hypothetical protein n=1 Tax=Paenibacillus sp. NAIST15-1 TaxID=1605994 RepID=UPI00086EB488|nr:hypothetical protein [Paenibacillus sp. NAIST15-1]GAV11484.1 hydrogenase (NiFe) small subunit HydA [Paenibacillus sp. NAIST15-1]
MEKLIVSELNRLQDDYFDAQEELFYHKNKYNEYRDECVKIIEEIRKNLIRLHDINPANEYEIESEIIL